MANKFLGLDSINVLKQYIDEQIISVNNNTRVITIQAYSYHKNGEKPIAPIGGGFDTEGINVIYPEGWYALNTLLNKYEDLETALSEGSIWMTAGVSQGTTDIVWSTPMKISGQNGVSIRFAYSYDENATEDKRTSRPSGVNEIDRVEYVWTQTGEDPWEGPTIWARYSNDASDLYWVYCVTGEKEIDLKKEPIKPDTPVGITPSFPWYSSMPLINLSDEYPYLWASYQRVAAGSEIDSKGWSEPVLFGHYGRNGDVPDYVQVLYRKGYSNPEISDIEGIVRPEKPAFIDPEENPDATIADYFVNGWVELPEPEYVAQLDENGDPVLDENGDPVMIESSEPIVWWQCSIKVDGRSNRVLSEDNIGAVKRYNSIDGTAKNGQFTMSLYAWSETQVQPEMSETLVDGWRPENYNYLPDRPLDLISPDASLWMITANVAQLDENGKPVVNGSWSEPVKLTGPRGPIGYDYRNETRYNWGTSDAPKSKPSEDIWYTANELKLYENSDFPYIWAVDYLMCYKMKYDTTAEPDENEEYPIVTDGDGTIIEQDIDIDSSYYRISGINGLDGNKKNSVIYNTGELVKSFAVNNYYIANTAEGEELTYTIDINPISFINGYTGKFANIGKGSMILNAGSDYKFVGSNTTATSLSINPQETVELICYKIDNEKVYLVIGKELTEVTE